MHFDVMKCSARSANTDPRPVRTFDTACIYYHKFRLVHGDNEYAYMVCRYPFALTGELLMLRHAAL